MAPTTFESNSNAASNHPKKKTTWGIEEDDTEMAGTNKGSSSNGKLQGIMTSLRPNDS